MGQKLISHNMQVFLESMRISKLTWWAQKSGLSLFRSVLLTIYLPFFEILLLALTMCFNITHTSRKKKTKQQNKQTENHKKIYQQRFHLKCKFCRDVSKPSMIPWNKPWQKIRVIINLAVLSSFHKLWLLPSHSMHSNYHRWIKKLKGLTTFQQTAN